MKILLAFVFGKKNLSYSLFYVKLKLLEKTLRQNTFNYLVTAKQIFLNTTIKGNNVIRITGTNGLLTYFATVKIFRFKRLRNKKYEY